MVCSGVDVTVLVCEGLLVPTAAGDEEIVSLCYQSFPVKSHRCSGFGRASLLLAPWGFLGLQEPECISLSAEWGP